MLVIPPTKNPRRIPPKAEPTLKPPTPPPAPLVFVSGIVDPGSYAVFLSFDRPIDIADVDVTQFTLDLAAGGLALVGSGAASYNGSNGIRVPMVVSGSYGGSDNRVSAAAGNGIVAVDDGGTWAGCSDVELPYPPRPPAGLSLAAASFDSGSNTVTLTFDRNIYAGSMAVDQVSVNDPSSGNMYIGTGSPTLVAPNAVQVTLTTAGPYGGDTTVLNASADTNLIAIDDGGTWDGATDLGLPYP
jgi:hypothetical protein